MPVHLRDALMNIVSAVMDRIESVGLQLSGVVGDSSLWQAYFEVRDVAWSCVASIGTFLSALWLRGFEKPPFGARVFPSPSLPPPPHHCPLHVTAPLTNPCTCPSV